jgi:hypothetical protein
MGVSGAGVAVAAHKEGGKVKFATDLVWSDLV